VLLLQPLFILASTRAGRSSPFGFGSPRLLVALPLSYGLFSLLTTLALATHLLSLAHALGPATAFGAATVAHALASAHGLRARTTCARCTRRHLASAVATGWAGRHAVFTRATSASAEPAALAHALRRRHTDASQQHGCGQQKLALTTSHQNLLQSFAASGRRPKAFDHDRSLRPLFQRCMLEPRPCQRLLKWQPRSLC
jgi:hypothetical protein